jgi:serine/threonine-protein kinase RIO1
MSLSWDFWAIRKDGIALMCVCVNGRAYPRLKDAVMEDDVYPVLYKQVLRDMRIMYQICRLVHADLSEFNLLYGTFERR